MAYLNIKISEKARHFAAVEAVKRGLPDAAAYAAALVEETADRMNGPHTLQDFFSAKTDLAELTRVQGVQPITDPHRLAADFWPADEMADDFITAVRRWREGPVDIEQHE